MKPKILTVRKRRMSGLKATRRFPKLPGAIYLPAGTVGKQFVVTDLASWRKIRREIKLLNLLSKELKRRGL